MQKMAIKRLGVLSVAKMLSIIYGMVGLITGVLYGLGIMFLGATMLSGSSSSRGVNEAAGGFIVVGLVTMVVTPIMTAIFGFIGGAILAFIYNLAAKMAGGIEMELENAGQQYSAQPPYYGQQQQQPPPPQWGGPASY
jgi:predicted DNA repair protein MutK